MKNQRIWTATFAIAMLGLIFPPSLHAQESPPPNIVIILTDDQGWGDLSLHGNTNLETPNLDSIGLEGAVFDQFFVCPVCAPTRAEFLTGRYHPRGGVRGVSRGAERLNLDERTFAEAFKAAGYATAAFGKWHNGTQYPYHPNARGFDEFYGFCSGHWGQYFDPILEHNGEAVRGKGFIIDDLTDHALDFIEANKDGPFLCYLPYNTPHSPFQVPDRDYAKFAEAAIGMRNRDEDKEEDLKTRAALAMVENIDWNVGRVLAKLDEHDLGPDTIVIFFSDNGPNSWRWNGGMKGKKGSTDEGGVRVPFHIRWPGRIYPGTKVTRIAGAIDILPTLMDLTGLSRVGEKPLDGRSLKSLLYTQAVAWPDRMIFTRQGRRVSVRTQQYRLDEQGKLFDMMADPGQRNDISAREPETAGRLAEAVEQWKAEVVAGLGQDDRPFPVGHAGFPSAFFPARDGIAEGGVERSAGAPNCSFFTNWTSEEGVMSWNIEVMTSGRYEAEIYYTCEESNIGSTVELSFNQSTISGKVAEGFDPPLVGESFDRSPRGSESYVKDFRPLSLGDVDLKAGRGLLTLRAIDIPGERVMDVRGIKLTLLR